jgi:predicted ester cyclase
VSASTTDTPSTTDTNKAIVRRFVDEVFVAGRLESVDDLVAPDFVPHSWPGTGPGPGELKRAMSRVFAGLSDVTMTIEGMIAEGDLVAVRLTAHAVQSGEFMGLPPSGRDYSIPEMHIFRVADGKVVEHWSQVDTLGMMRQLGAMPGQD